MNKYGIYLPLRVFLLVLLAAVTILVTSVWFVLSRDFQYLNVQFQSDAQLLYDDLSRNLGDIDAVTSGFVALHNTIDAVDAEQFSHYAQEMLKNYPRLHTIKLLTKVDHPYRERFVQQVREERFPNFDIYTGPHDNPAEWREAEQQRFYFPVTEVEPVEPDKIREIGYDLYTLPDYRNAINRAVVTGKAAVIAPVNLMNDTAGFMVFKAVYAGRITPADQTERQQQTVFIINVVMQAEDLLILPRVKPEYAVKIYGVNNESAMESLVYQLDAGAERNNEAVFTELSFSQVVERPGHSLRLAVTYPVGFEVLKGSDVYTVLVIWSVFTLLVLFMANMHYHRLSEREQSFRAWQWEKERADVTLHSLADAVITTNVKGVIEYMNPVAERLTGWRASEAKGHGIEDVFAIYNEQTEQKVACPVIESIQRGATKKSDSDLSLINKQGDHSSVDFSIAPMYGQHNLVLGAVVVFQDVGSSRMMSKLLTYQATHDDLTGLYNRREFERRLSRALERVYNYNERHIVLYMDLDQFKVVNDTCGHVGGDLVLRQIAELIKSLIKEKETLARLGGDEFGVLLEGYTLDEAKEIAIEMMEAVRKYRFHWSGKIFEIGISIGIVDIDSGMESISNIMSYADAACYLAKDVGGNHVQVYKRDDEDYMQRKDQMTWVQKITQAFADNRFILYAQKIVPLQGDKQEHHYEILMRMQDDHGNVIVPQEYIIAAERYRTMKDIDRWVIRNAFIFIDRFLSAKPDDPLAQACRFSVNISGQTLSSESGRDYVLKQLEDYPSIKDHLIFEITETAAISNIASAHSFIDQFRGMGVQFSLDDFGTGVSSFNYLKNLDVDYLKIDGGFVTEMLADPVDFAMVKSIAHIGNVMNIKTIAEHAESEMVCEKLREMGVDYAQGYWLHEPEDLENLV